MGTRRNRNIDGAAPSLDFLVPCGPSRISMWSTFAPGCMIRATAEINPARAERTIERSILRSKMSYRPVR